MSYRKHLEVLRALPSEELSIRAKRLVDTSPEKDWPVGMPSSIDPKLVLIGVSPGNSPMQENKVQEPPAFNSYPSIRPDSSSHFYYPDGAGYWERLRFLSKSFFNSRDQSMDEGDAISMSTHLNLGTGSAGRASTADVERDYVEWVSYLLNTKFKADLVVLFGLKKILTNETVNAWWNHDKGLKIDWNSPSEILPFEGYTKRSYKFRIWRAENQLGHKSLIVLWPNHPSRAPFRNLDVWRASVSEFLNAVESGR